MILSIVVAKSKNNVIGKGNQLPWHLPADLKHFKSVTMGKPIVMGRKTFESIGRPLPGRRNVVISRDKNYSALGCDVFHSIDAALAELKNEKEVMIIGGANLYQQLLPLVTRIYLTEIDLEIEGDAFFPELDLSRWHALSRENYTKDEKNSCSFSFQLWEKR